jgi:carboxymethylenebutenolidase
VSSSAVTPRFPLYVTGSGDAGRALIVVQEGFGVNAHVRDVADRVAEAGYFAVAPHLYHREGSPEVPYDDVDQAIALIGSVTREGLTNDLNATTDFLLGMGYHARSIGVMGFCMGGSVAFFASTLGTVGAGVSFYGGGLAKARMGLPPLLELAAELVSPWLGLYGDLDAGIPVEDVEELRRVTERLDVATEIVRYLGAQHGFHCDARPAVYDKAAATDAYQRAMDFLNAHLVER